MAKTNRKSGISGVSERMASAEQSKPTAVVSRPGSTQTSARTQIGDTSKTAGPTQEQIADRAKQIWRQKGCPAGQDQTNWYEAEAQLKRELAVR
jgi:hypothetical protein